MTVDAMRKIDYYLGVPLCFGVTWIRRLLFWWFPKKRLSPQRVLFIELSEMGSAILVDPAMQKLKKAGCQIYFVIFKKNKASLEILGTVQDSHIFLIREDGLWTLAWDTLRFFVWCRRQKIDSVIDLELFSRFTALLTAFCGSQNNVGFYKFHNEGLYRGDFLTKKVAYNPHIHIAKNFIALVNALLSREDQVPFTKSAVKEEEVQLRRATINADAQDSVREKIRRSFPSWQGEELFLINANASDMLPQRRWPASEFIKLIQQLLGAYDNILVLLTGAPAERPGLQAIADGVADPRCVNFAGQVQFKELVPLYSLAKIMISNDSGPPHFASVTELHTFVLFGPETPSLYGSLGQSTTITAGLACSPCVSAWNHRKTPCSDNQCLKQITANDVFKVVAQSYPRDGITSQAMRRVESPMQHHVVLNQI